jgi:hypothetical protein
MRVCMYTFVCVRVTNLHNAKWPCISVVVLLACPLVAALHIVTSDKPSTECEYSDAMRSVTMSITSDVLASVTVTGGAVSRKLTHMYMLTAATK